MLDKILECYLEEGIAKADGFDDAIIGIDIDSYRLIYSVSKCIKILEKKMNFQEAQEFFDFNIVNAYIGKKSPIWCYDDF